MQMVFQSGFRNVAVPLDSECYLVPEGSFCGSTIRRTKTNTKICNIFWDRSNVVDSSISGMGYNIPNSASSLGRICRFHKLHIPRRESVSFIVSTVCNLFGLSLK